MQIRSLPFFVKYLRKKSNSIATIEEEPFIQKPVIGERHFKAASARQHKGINMAHLKGTNYEMGFQHAVLYKQEILEQTLPFYSNVLKSQIEHGAGKTAADILMKILDQTALRYVKKNIRKKDLEIYQGISDALEIDFNQLLWVAVAPDFLQYAGGLAARKKLTLKFPQSLLGCTSFIAKDNATPNGNMILAHNKDYAGMEIWDRYPTVFFCEPKGKSRYVMLGAPGFHTASLNTLNEHGVTLTVHTLFTNDVTLKGEPMVFVGRRIMESARTAKEAVAMMSGVKFMVGWNMLISDKNGDMATIETSASGNTVNFHEGDAHAFSNIYRNELGKTREINLTPAVRGNSEQRYFRMKDLIQKHFGKLSPKLAPALLSDHFDMILGHDRSVGNVIAQNMNVMSSIFDLTEMKIWIADGQSPTCYGTYRGFNFEDGFTGEFSEVEDYPGPYTNSKTHEGVRYYIQAERAVYHHKNYKQAADLLLKAMKCDKNEFLYPCIAGICLIFAREYENAIDLLLKANELDDLPQRKGLGKLWLARAYQLLGNGDQAKKYLKEIFVDKEIDSVLKDAAIKGMHNTFKKSKLNVFPVDFWMGDSIFY